MDEAKKKHYVTPELYRVDLDHEQAILSACSLLATNSMAGGIGAAFCRQGNCKNADAAGMSDSGPRPSYYKTYGKVSLSLDLEADRMNQKKSTALLRSIVWTSTMNRRF